MLLSDAEIQERLESPINLMNRLRQLGNPAPVVSLPPKSDEIIPNLDEKLNDTRSKAVGILNATMDELRRRLPEVQKPEKLAIIAKEMSQVVAHQDSKSQGSIQAGQIIVYAPQMASIEQFEIIDVQEETS